ncbi:MAG: mannose-6-phosphate isomerase, partial [Verrucomicrobiae bacterium]|nr:mannose-6-phosphate isomerase [Verrucomicrobiae bacterium]
AGDAIFIPSGRIHAIDAGLVIVEVQQNSDTTYRVYDWGRPRPLHIAESLASINFNDYEPSVQPLPIECEHFRVELLNLHTPHDGLCDGSSFHILIPLNGTLHIETAGNPTETASTAEFVLLPAALGRYRLLPGGTLLKVTAPAATFRP